MAAAGVELGGVEYMLDDRAGDKAIPLYYDINALSNFVADGEQVVGFDPFVRLVDWLSVEAAKADAQPPAAAKTTQKHRCLSRPPGVANTSGMQFGLRLER